MSRRHLTLVVVAIASLVVSACGTSPTGPRPTAPSFEAGVDTLPRIGTSGSNG
jgi:hypothetical protein